MKTGKCFYHFLIVFSLTCLVQSGVIIQTTAPPQLIEITTNMHCETLGGPCPYGYYDSQCNCIQIQDCKKNCCFTAYGFCDNTDGNCACLDFGLSPILSATNPFNIITTTVSMETAPIPILFSDPVPMPAGKCAAS